MVADHSKPSLAYTIILQLAIKVQLHLLADLHITRINLHGCDQSQLRTSNSAKELQQGC